LGRRQEVRRSGGQEGAAWRHVSRRVGEGFRFALFGSE